MNPTKKLSFLRYSIALTLLSLVMLSIATFLYYPLFGNEVGDKLGQVAQYIVPFVVASIILGRFATNKKGIGFLILSILFFLTSAYQSATMMIQVYQVKSVVKDVSSIAKGALSDEDTRHVGAADRNYGELTPLMRLMNDFSNQTEADLDSLMNQISREGISTALSPGTMRDLRRLSDARTRMQSIIALIDADEGRLLQRYNELDAKFNALDLPPNLEASAQQGYKKGRAKGLRDMQEFYSIERSLVSEILELLDFLRSRYASYRFKNDNILFNSDEDAATYENHVNIVTAFANRLTTWAANIQTSGRRQIKEFEKLVK